jgi:hypothetical protein
MNYLDVPKIVLSVSNPGEYFGEEAHKKINQITAAIHGEVTNACAYYSKMDLLDTFYNFFDTICCITIDGTYWVKDEDSMLKALLKSPSTGRYLLETSICYGGNEENKPVNKEIKEQLLAAGLTFVSYCNISNFFYSRINNRNGFRIDANGTIEELITEQSQKIMDDYFEKMRIRERGVIVNANPNGKKEDYFFDLAKSYDEPFKKKYGFSLTSIVSLAIIMYGKRKERLGIIKTSRKDLLKKVEKEYEGDLDEQIKLFEITAEYLAKDWRYYKIYGVPISVVRKPIINLSNKVGGGGTVVYGGFAMLHSLAFIFKDIEHGNIELELKADKIQAKIGKEFEKKLVPELSKCGLKVIHIPHTSDEVGDIDAVAFNPNNNSLMIIEAKSPRINIDVIKIKKQVEDTKEWYRQLGKKVDWVKDNLDLVKKSLRIDNDCSIHMEGMIVTEVPWFFETHPNFKMFTLEELKLLLKNKATS